jgi:hypothetical protein
VLKLFRRVAFVRRRHQASIGLCVAALFLCSGNSLYEPSPSTAAIAARAFVIVDPEALAPFTFDRVIGSLSSEPSSAWLETIARRDAAPRRRQVVMPLTGFIASAEDGSWLPAGSQGWAHMKPIAIVNRFDLAPADFSHCGEYRLIFSRRTGNRTRLHIAVEAILPNPNPRLGGAGCAGVAAFWWELAATASANARRERLEGFFFRGLPSFPPVLDPRGFERTGRIRTSEISDGRPRFAQFELKRHCEAAQPCVARLTRVPLDNAPDGTLFDGDTVGERAASFRRDFLRQVASLSINDVNRYFMNVDRAYSVDGADRLIPAFNYRLPFRRAQRTAAGQMFRQQIARELKRPAVPSPPKTSSTALKRRTVRDAMASPAPSAGAWCSRKRSSSASTLRTNHCSGTLVCPRR